MIKCPENPLDKNRVLERDDHLVNQTGKRWRRLVGTLQTTFLAFRT